MTGLDIIPIALFAAVAVACVISIVLLGAQAWVVPAVSLPPAFAYILLDRRLKQREGSGHG